MSVNYSYHDCLTASERINWRVEDLIGGGKRLDFSKPLLPEALARVESLSFLTPAERKTINQIRGHSYLCIFGLVEEFILPFVLDHVRAQLDGDDFRIRALLRFAGEEAKHIHLFKLFREEFEKDFGVRCEIIGPPVAIANEVLSHSPLGVCLAILHIEWMTQRHYLESVKGDGELDPQFKNLLKHHWQEEAQHAKLDTLILEALTQTLGEDEIMVGIDEYLAIGRFLDDCLEQQTKLDLESFETTRTRDLTDEEKEELFRQQHQANRWTYLGTGMTHPKVLETLGHLSPAGRDRVEKVGSAFC